MMRLLVLLAFVCALLSMPVAAALGAANPSGTGPPSVECGDPGATSAPAGFSTDGFANAESHYAPSSQYDVACYQQTQNAH
jgi:hypothetical protein